jgi:hypothetical protein
MNHYNNVLRLRGDPPIMIEEQSQTSTGAATSSGVKGDGEEDAEPAAGAAGAAGGTPPVAPLYTPKFYTPLASPYEREAPTPNFRWSRAPNVLARAVPGIVQPPNPLSSSLANARPPFDVPGLRRRLALEAAAREDEEVDPPALARQAIEHQLLFPKPFDQLTEQQISMLPDRDPRLAGFSPQFVDQHFGVGLVDQRTDGACVEGQHAAQRVTRT